MYRYPDIFERSRESSQMAFSAFTSTRDTLKVVGELRGAACVCSLRDESGNKEVLPEAGPPGRRLQHGAIQNATLPLREL